VRDITCQFRRDTCPFTHAPRSSWRPVCSHSPHATTSPDAIAATTSSATSWAAQQPSSFALICTTSSVVNGSPVFARAATDLRQIVSCLPVRENVAFAALEICRLHLDIDGDVSRPLRHLAPSAAFVVAHHVSLVFWATIIDRFHSHTVTNCELAHAAARSCSIIRSIWRCLPVYLH